MFTQLLTLVAAFTGISSVNMTLKDKIDKSQTYEIHEFIVYKDTHAKKWKIRHMQRWLKQAKEEL
jgi:hypothetical protein